MDREAGGLQSIAKEPDKTERLNCSNYISIKRKKNKKKLSSMVPGQQSLDHYVPDPLN